MVSNEMLMYLMKVVLIHGLFFLLYHLVLRTKLNYTLNRGYLLSTLVLAFAIPLVEIPIEKNSIPQVVENPVFFITETVPEKQKSIVVEQTEIMESSQPVDPGLIVLAIYGCITFGLMFRSLFHLVILQKLKKQSVYVKKQWFKLFKTSQIHPFSFLTNVFIPKKIFGTDSFDQILEHECEHVRQYHSLDRLLVDFMVALFWFNPFMYLYRRALIEIHEYQADAAVLKKFADPIGYQEVLFSQLNSAQYSGLVSHFNFSTIKKRIVMINKQNNKRSIWAYVLAIPVTLWVILAFSSRSINEPGMEALIIENTKTENHVPSISPVSENDLNRPSSGFGMRTHPIYKVKKMHWGVDFSVAVGTEVVATADGKISKTETKFGGYGKMITIDHGEKYQTRYTQLSTIEVKEGQWIKKDERIGLSGNSGASITPHLHYEVIEVGVGNQDPIEFIDNPAVKTIEENQEMMEVEPKAQQETSVPSILPLKETGKMRVTSSFGIRTDPFDNKRKMHKGLDLGTPIGTTVIATADGEVHQATYDDKYGYFVLIQHGDKYMTRYSQLSNLSVSRGDKVTKGQKVALSGSSGRSTGPHLHYEVIETGSGHKNPVLFIKNHKFKMSEIIVPSPKRDDAVDGEDSEDGEEEELPLEIFEDEEVEVERAKIQEELEAVEKERVREMMNQEEREVVLAEELQKQEIEILEESERVVLERSRYDEMGITTDPLYILDGEVKKKSEVYELVVDDIEHVEVMKGKNATRKYGKEADGGVIIITTKKNKDKVKGALKRETKQKTGSLIDGESNSTSKIDWSEMSISEKRNAIIEAQKRIMKNEPFRVLIDAGHGGVDPGVTSPTGKLEKDVSLAIAKLIESNFENSHGIDIILSRGDDERLGLEDRVDLSENADLMISLHADFNSDAQKSVILSVYNDQKEDSERSETVARLLVNEFGGCGDGVLLGSSTGNYVLNNASCPAVSLNIGNFSNVEVAKQLSSRDGQIDIANRVTKAIKFAAL